jgi:ATP-dependent DNA helicase DinG
MQLNTTPYHFRDIPAAGRGSARAWIFTSATLSVKQDFSHHQQEMGLEESQAACWDSRFDYRTQALMYVPASTRPAAADTTAVNRCDCSRY